MRPLVLLCLAGSCWYQPHTPNTNPKPSPGGYATKMGAAAEADRRAEVNDEIARENSPDMAERYGCGDKVLNNTVTTEGHPVTYWVPCWNISSQTMQRHDTLATSERAQARADRRAAARLAEAEAAACANISDADRSRSPFVHRDDIDAVLPHRESGVLRGVRVVFKVVPALDATWMRRAIACHQAHVAMLGHVPPSLADDPTLLPGARVSVGQQGPQVTVLVETSPDLAPIAIAQASGQAVEAPPQTATR